MGLNAALQVGARSLEIFSTGIQVAGQNVSNANTPGYIRENLLLDPSDPYRQGALILGTGVEIGGIRQSIDLFLEKRLHNANSDYAAAEASSLLYEQLQVEINELGEEDLSTQINDFLAAINEITNQPESSSLRSLVSIEGENLAQEIVMLRDRVNSLRQAQSVKVESLVTEANELIDEIDRLNPQISKMEASGLLQSDAGALRSQRYEALNRLSEIIPIRFAEREDGAVDLYTGNDYLILTGSTQHLQLNGYGDREVVVHDIVLSNTDAVLGQYTGSSGELLGVIEGRDEVLGGFIDELDQLTSTLIFEFNKIHSSGEGLVGFNDVTSTESVNDINSVLNDAGLFFNPTHGSFNLKVTNSGTGISETTNIAIDLDGIGADSTLESVRAAIDAVDQISATITADGRLEISSADGYDFRFGDDTSGFLASIGINTFFSGTDSSNISINDLVKNDPQLIATGRGGGSGDNSNVVQLATIFDQAFDGLSNQSLSEFYDTTINDIAQEGAAAESLAAGTLAFRDGLANQREQFSGVSLDEEAIKIMNYQHAYQAAARIITAVDELYEILLAI